MKMKTRMIPHPLAPSPIPPPTLPGRGGIGKAFAACVLGTFLAAALPAETIVITNATIHTMGPQGTIKNGTLVIENGKIRRKALAQELLTESELLTICHRQGFADLDDVQTAVLEPGGTFFLKGLSPSEEDNFRKEVLTRLEKISERLEHLPK